MKPNPPKATSEMKGSKVIKVQKITTNINTELTRNKLGTMMPLITPFTFECGHNIPESKGGTSDIDNLRPICGNCNRSMSNSYTIDEFSNMSKRASHLFECFLFKKSATN